MVDSVDGLVSAAQELVDVDQDPPGSMPGEQAALFPLSKTEDLGAAKSGTPARGVGRPPGARNKNTEAWRDFLLSRYPSPLQGLAEIMSRRVTELAKELGYLVQAEDGTVLRKPKPEELTELLKIQIAAMKELAPYVHSKMPLAVDAGENGLISLVINAGQQTQQNQGVVDVEFLDLDAAELDAATQSTENKGENDE